MNEGRGDYLSYISSEDRGVSYRQSNIPAMIFPLRV